MTQRGNEDVDTPDTVAANVKKKGKKHDLIDPKRVKKQIPKTKLGYGTGI